jgi:hypothetical protein
MRRLHLLAGWAALLSGCANPPLTLAGGQYDGTYHSRDILVSGVAFQCGTPSIPEEIQIRDGRFAYPFQVSPPRVAPLPVEIAGDGTMAGQMQYGTGEEIPAFSRDRIDWVYLRGRISGTILDATITTMRCARQLTGQLGS